MKYSTFNNKGIKSFLDFFSRIAISAIFISAIPGKINSFEKTINNAVKKFKVSKDELMGYFEKEMLTIGK